MTHDKHDSAPQVDQAAAVAEPLDPYHGDLRKGAFLKRRAAYQMQASAASAPQAGTPVKNRR